VSQYRALCALVILLLARGAAAGETEPRGDSGCGDRALHTVLVAGGASPATNHVSFEQDLELALEVFAKPAAVFLGGGSGAPTVQELAPHLGGDPLRARLAEILDPRPWRRSRYRRPRVECETATAGEVLSRLDEALSCQGGPVTVYIAAHGEQGETPAESIVGLWGDSYLTVADIAELHDESAGDRELRLVVASCFSGSFAEIAFKGADEQEGPARRHRCGLFASTWDGESTGCDSNPRRDEQESYGMHVLQALAGRDRDGRPLATGELDLDRDGEISLLEAHTRARVALHSIDVPTTTSEWFLRHSVTDESGDERPVTLPEEEAVIVRLGVALGLRDTEAVERELDRLESVLEDLDAELLDLETALTTCHVALTLRLLERWPVLDDPWHPEFESVLERDRTAITALLDRSPEARVHRLALQRVEVMTQRWSELEVRYVRALRLERSHETRRLARRLMALGGPAWAHYQQLLKCERGSP